MLRSLAGLLAWLLSVLFRVALVLAVVGLAAGFAFGVFDLPGEAIELTGGALGTGGVSDSGGGIGGLGAADESSAANASAVPSSNTTELNGTELEYLVHEQVNEERTERGRSKLTFDTDLRPVARYHSADMARRDYFSHVGPDGETLTDRYERFGYRCRVRSSTFQYATGGENILYTYYDAPVTTENDTARYDTPEKLARGIVDGWMNSTSHRENLLKPYWQREAIGIYIEETEGQTRVYATQNFC